MLKKGKRLVPVYLLLITAIFYSLADAAPQKRMQRRQNQAQKAAKWSGLAIRNSGP